MQTLAVMCTVFVVVVTIISIVCSVNEDSKFKDKPLPVLKRLRKIGYWLIIPIWLLYIVIPTKSDILMIMAGGSVGNFIEGDKSIKEIPHEITLFLKEELAKQIREVKGDSVKNVIKKGVKDGIKEVIK